MRILVACEESQRVTIALRERGHEAYSCDIVPCSGGHPEWHLQQDVTPLLKEKWDMIIAFPPCTHLAVSGARHFEKKRADGRQRKGIEFFAQFLMADCPRIAIENPIGIISGSYIPKWFPDLAEKFNLPKKPTQIIHPWQFGDKAEKSTCLWLKGLPELTPTNIVEKGEFKEWIAKDGTKKRQPKWFYDALVNSKTAAERATIRSKTFPGIAKAMADQWAGTSVTVTDFR